MCKTGWNKEKGNIERIKNTVKVVVLRGDYICKDIIFVSLYNSKPVALGSTGYWITGEYFWN